MSDALVLRIWIAIVIISLTIWAAGCTSLTAPLLWPIKSAMVLPFEKEPPAVMILL